MFVRAFLVLMLLASPALADKYKARKQREFGPASQPTTRPNEKTMTLAFPCDCPNDRAADKSRCGGRSAWCKTGGREPVCSGASEADCKADSPDKAKQEVRVIWCAIRRLAVLHRLRVPRLGESAARLG